MSRSGLGDGQNPPNEKEAPCGANLPISVFSFPLFFVPTWLNRDRIGAFRSGGGVLLAWPWFAVEALEGI